jgi:hypothetical protein
MHRNLFDKLLKFAKDMVVKKNHYRVNIRYVATAYRLFLSLNGSRLFCNISRRHVESEFNFFLRVFLNFPCGRTLKTNKKRINVYFTSALIAFWFCSFDFETRLEFNENILFIDPIKKRSSYH